ENGVGVEPDMEQAVTWYTKAADQGFAMAESNLGNLYAWGHGVPRDPAIALKWVSPSRGKGARVRDLQHRVHVRAGSRRRTELGVGAAVVHRGRSTGHARRHVQPLESVSRR